MPNKNVVICIRVCGLIAAILCGILPWVIVETDSDIVSSYRGVKFVVFIVVGVLLGCLAAFNPFHFIEASFKTDSAKTEWGFIYLNPLVVIALGVILAAMIVFFMWDSRFG